MGPETSLDIEGNLARVRESIREAALRANRSPEEIRFILVSKTVAPDGIRQAVQAGVDEFGENRVQELLKKKPELPASLKWHMIGHLQTNKVKQVLGEVVLIHSLDRLELLQEIERQAEKKGLGEINCLIEINSSGELSKSGAFPEEVSRLVSAISKDSPVRIRGLMTVGPLTEDPEAIRRAFRLVKNLQEKLIREFPKKDWGILSMGMSGDYRIAIEEGANLLRIGSAVFGARPGRVPGT